MQILCSFYNKYFEDLFFKEHDLCQHPDITMVFLVTFYTNKKDQIN